MSPRMQPEVQTLGTSSIYFMVFQFWRIIWNRWIWENFFPDDGDFFCMCMFSFSVGLLVKLVDVCRLSGTESPQSTSILTNQSALIDWLIDWLTPLWAAEPLANCTTCLVPSLFSPDSWSVISSRLFLNYSSCVLFKNKSLVFWILKVLVSFLKMFVFVFFVLDSRLIDKNSKVFVLEICPLASWFLMVFLWPCVLSPTSFYGSYPLVCPCSVSSCPRLLPYPTLTASVEVVSFWLFMNSSCRHLQFWAAAPPTVTRCWRRSRGNSRRPATPRNTRTRRPVGGPCRRPPASSSSSPSLTSTWRRRRAASTTGSWWTLGARTLSSVARRPTGWRWTRRGTWWSCPLPPTSACRRGGSVLASDTVGSGWHRGPVLQT